MKKRVISLLVAVAMIVTMLPVLSAATGEDAAGHWGEAALTWAVDNGIIVGDSNGNLMPDGALSRSQLTAIIVRTFGATETADISNFSDVDENAWYYADIQRGVRMGVILGTSETTMEPERSITHQEACVILAKAFGISTEKGISGLSGFSDSGNTANWAKIYVAALARGGYLAGLPNTSAKILDPTGVITRAEFTTILKNLVGEFYTEAGTYKSDVTGNAFIKVSDVVLKDMKVSGNVIIADGVGTGDSTLDSVSVSGRLIVRGGGAHSNKLVGTTSVNGIDLVNVSADNTHIAIGANVVVGNVVANVNLSNGSFTISGGAVDSVTVNAGANVSFDGTAVNTVTLTTADNQTVVVSDVSATATVAISQDVKGNNTVSVDGKVGSIQSSAANLSISLGSGATVQSIVLAESASGTTISGDKGATVAAVETKAADTTIVGNTAVQTVSAPADVTVTTGNNVTVNQTVNTTTGTTTMVTPVTQTPSTTVPMPIITYYTVNFVNYGNSVFATRTVAAGSKVAAIDTPTTSTAPPDYSFIRWGNIDGTAFDFNTAITGDTNIYAYWAKKVGTAADLTAAFGTTGDYILTTDIALTATQTVGANANVNIDLNGHTIISNIASGKVAITDNGNLVINDTVGNGKITGNSEKLIRVEKASGQTDAPMFTLYAGELVNTDTNNGTVIRNANGNVMICGGAISGVYGITVWQNAVTTIIGGTITATGFAIAGNGTSVNGGTTLTIEGGTLTSTDIAMYLPQLGTTTISGGNITGKSGIEIKAGTLNISGGSITGTGTYDANPDVNSNGSSSSGDAIAIVRNSAYQDNINVNITGGTLNSTNGNAIHEVDHSGSDIKNLSIRDATLNGKVAGITVNGNIVIGQGQIFSINQPIVGSSTSATPPTITIKAGATVSGEETSLNGIAASSQYTADTTYTWTGSKWTTDAVVSTEEGLSAAITQGKNVLLTADFIASVTIPSGKNITLDLNGHILSVKNKSSGTGYDKTYNVINIASGATLTLKDTANGGKIYGANVANASAVSLVDCYGTFIMESGTIEAGDNVYYAFGLCGSNCVATINGGTIKSVWSNSIDGCAIGANGNTSEAGYRLTVNNNAVITGGEQAMYLPSAGNVVINGGTISGTKEGIEIRAGNLTINGGTIIATAARATSASLNNGASGNYTGALVIARHSSANANGYYGNIVVNIKSATLQNSTGDAICITHDGDNVADGYHVNVTIEATTNISGGKNYWTSAKTGDSITDGTPSSATR